MTSLNDLKRIFERDKWAQYASLSEFRLAKKYYDGEQLSQAQLAVLASRGQPPIIENIFKLVTNKILSYKASSVANIKVLGRQETDKPLAALLNDILKTLTDTKLYSKVTKKRDADLIHGIGVIEIYLDKEQDCSGHCQFETDSVSDYKIKIAHIQPENFVIDKFSMAEDASDATSLHKIIHVDTRSMPFEVIPDDYQDYRAEIYETWLKEQGIWNRYIWQDSKLLSVEYGAFGSANIHPFIIQKFYIDNKNQFYGIFRDIKPMQDYVNFSENRTLNIIGSMKAFFEQDAVLDPEQFIEDASLDNAVVMVRAGALSGNKLQFVEGNPSLNILQQKISEKRNLAKQLSGLNDELMGQGGERESSKTVLNRQQAGILGLRQFLKACDDMDENIMSKAITLIQHFFKKPQIFRIVDRNVAERYFSINTNDSNRIKVGNFDIWLESRLKTGHEEGRMEQWGDILKILSNTEPDLVSGLLPLIIKDIDPEMSLDIKELIQQKQEAAQKAAENDNGLAEKKELLEVTKLEKEVNKIDAEAREIISDASKKEKQTELIELAMSGENNGEYKVVEGDKVVTRNTPQYMTSGKM